MTKEDLGGFEEVVLESGLSAEEIVRRLRQAARLADVGERTAAACLAELEQRGLHEVRGAGCADGRRSRGAGARDPEAENP